MDGKNVFDLIIVGAGTAGISAAVRAQELQLNYLVLEKGKALNTFIENYPANSTKKILTYPKNINNETNIPFEECTREELLERWGKMISERKLEINEQERVLKIQKEEDSFRVYTENNFYDARFAMVATGVQGVPRRLGAKGEEGSNVFYGLKEPKKFDGKKVLIVGGGDVAVESALALKDIAEVSVSYRGNEFTKAKEENLLATRKAMEEKKVRVIFSSAVSEISDKEVVLDVAGEKKIIRNDAVIVCIGNEMPVELLKNAGMLFDERGKIAISEKNETSVKGLFVAGDVAGLPLIKNALNQGKRIAEEIARRLGKQN